MNGATIKIGNDQCLIKSFTVYSNFISCFNMYKSAAWFNWMIGFGKHTLKWRETTEVKKNTEQTNTFVELCFSFQLFSDCSSRRCK